MYPLRINYCGLLIVVKAVYSSQGQTIFMGASALTCQVELARDRNLAEQRFGFSHKWQCLWQVFAD